MNIEKHNLKEARELILQPGKGRFQLIDKVLLPSEIMGESVSVLLHRVCSRLTIRKEDVSYIGFYTWVQSYRNRHKPKVEELLLPESTQQTSTSEVQDSSSSKFSFSDPSKIKDSNPQSTQINFV